MDLNPMRKLGSRQMNFLKSKSLLSYKKEQNPYAKSEQQMWEALPDLPLNHRT